MQTLNITYKIEKTNECGGNTNYMLICNETGMCVGTKTKKQAVELMRDGGWEIIDKWALTEPIKIIDKYGEFIVNPI